MRLRDLKLLLMGVMLLGLAKAADLQTAAGHPMQYYVSLPEGWVAGRNWPVVVVIESASKEFEATAELFRKARGKLPFVLVTPLVVTNGGARALESPTYHYPAAVWDRVRKDGNCRFDTEGLAAMVTDVRARYGADDRYFLTGLEAGGHTVWMQLFTRAEALRGVVLVAPNYQGRCVEDLGYSRDSGRASLPVKILGGAQDAAWRAGQPLWEQTVVAEKNAAAHGFGALSRMIVPGKGHEWMPSEILAFFADLYTHKQ